MPQRDSAPLGAPCWVDLASSDTDKAEDFYGQLFGWTAEHSGEEYGGYINFRKDGHPIAGAMKNDGSSGFPDGWTVYLATDNVEKTAEVAADNGGQVMMPVMEVMTEGSMAILSDAGQAVIGAWQPGTHKGFGLIGEPGSPNWIELHTRDYAASVKFYQDVFGWETHVMSDTDEFRYTTLGEGDTALAGIMDSTGFLPDGVPAHWSIYFGVEDVDASLEKVAELGGSLIQPAEDTPFGRLAQVADPTGAVFKIVAPVR